MNSSGRFLFSLAVSGFLFTQVTFAQNPLRAQSAPLSVTVSDLRWMPLSEWDADSFRGAQRHALAFGYDLREKNQPVGPNRSEFWLENEVGQKIFGGSSDRKRGDAREAYVLGADPRSQEWLFLVWEVMAADAPDSADGRTVQTLDFKIPLSQSGAKTEILPSQTTARGALIGLQKIERQEKTVVLHLTATVPPDVGDFYLHFDVKAQAARDDQNTDLTANRALHSGTITTGKQRDFRLTLPVAAAANASTIQLALDVTESAPSQKQPQYFHRVRVPFDLAQVAAPPEKPATPALATLEKEALRSEVEAVTLFPKNQQTARVQLWFESQNKRGIWRIKDAKVQASDGTQPFVHRGNEVGNPYFFNRNDKIAQAGEGGLELNFARPQSAETFALEGVAEQIEAAQKRFVFSKIPFPTRAGEVVKPKMVQKHADGSQLILWKVGRFDTQNQPILGPYSPNPNKLLEWEGLVLVWEYRSATPGHAKVRFDDLEFGDNKGRKYPHGAPMQNSSFGGHDGDVWRTTRDKDASGLTFSETRRTWYSLFKPVPASGATELQAEMKITENTTLATLDFRFENLKTPAPSQ